MHLTRLSQQLTAARGLVSRAVSWLLGEDGAALLLEDGTPIIMET